MCTLSGRRMTHRKWIRGQHWAALASAVQCSNPFPVGHSAAAQSTYTELNVWRFGLVQDCVVGEPKSKFLPAPAQTIALSWHVSE